MCYGKVRLFIQFAYLLAHRLLFDAIEKSLRKTAGERLIPSLYRGTLVNKIVCLKCNCMYLFSLMDALGERGGRRDALGGLGIVCIFVNKFFISLDFLGSLCAFCVCVFLR